MGQREPMQGNGRFQWNAGGWFGAQLGSTLWLLLAGLTLVAKQQPLSGAIVLNCFFMANVVGVFLWRHRHAIAPYPAIQILIGWIGVMSLVAIAAVDYYDSLALLDARLADHRWAYYAILGVFPGLMLLFHLMERTGGEGTSSAN